MAPLLSVVNGLEAVASFPVPAAAAAVVGSNGLIATAGPTSERFPLASVTKLLSAFAVLVATEERTVALTDACGPVGSTVAHLLSHASGLHPSDRSRVLAPPATRRIYSNAGFEVLCEQLAQRAEMNVSSYLEGALTGPLGMKDTVLRGSPAHGATSTVTDLALFCRELLCPKLVSSETLRLATTTAFPGIDGVLPGFGMQRPCDWGLGFEPKSTKAPHWTGQMNSVSTFGHFGQSGTFVWVDPAVNLALVMLSDRPFGDWARVFWPALSDAVIACQGVATT